MQRSVIWWMRAAYRRRENQITQDAGPARDLSQELQSVMRDWLKKYNEAAETLAQWFADKNSQHVRNSTREAFKAAGIAELFTVKFRYMSRHERDVLQSIIIENVNLIKSIPQHYFTEVQGLVQRCVQNGRDLGYLTDELGKRYQITRRRAAMIARDQTNKATENLSRARMQSLGITKGIWIHTSAGKTYRHTHVEMNGKEFDLSKGMYDSAVGREVFPGELVNCFPGNSKLYGLPFVEKLYRRFYRGELTELVTINGVVLRVTPNHPILTLEGWKAAGLVDCGDYIFQIGAKDRYVRELNRYGAIPTFENFFEAFVGHGASASIFGCAECDFHGDVSDGEIDVIDVNSFLTDKTKTSLFKKGREFGFTRSEVRGIAGVLSGGCVMTSLAMGHFSATSFTGSVSKRLSVFLGSLTIAELVCLFSISRGNPSSQNATTNDIAGTPKMAGNFQLAYAGLVHGYDLIFGDKCSIIGSSVSWNGESTLPNMNGEVVGADPQLFSNRFKHLTFGETFYRVVDKRVSEFSGHVYNLQTSLGWYIADHTVAHNCRCTYKPIIS
ncbi:hypothetical protein B5F39_02700 [Cloacibacillus sp. An23]|nr:hypothetical protein B5F39_02700 [Cloacibacillus sp. An23]